MNSKNKLYTLSYFKKRLKDAGIESTLLVNGYNDKRYWTILVDPKDKKIFCTCFRFPIENNKQIEYYFYFSDGKQCITPVDKIIKTESMIVIIDFLKEKVK